MGKSTISTGPFSIAFWMFTRPGIDLETWKLWWTPQPVIIWKDSSAYLFGVTVNPYVNGGDSVQKSPKNLKDLRYHWHPLQRWWLKSQYETLYVCANSTIRTLGVDRFCGVLLLSGSLFGGGCSEVVRTFANDPLENDVPIGYGSKLGTPIIGWWILN